MLRVSLPVLLVLASVISGCGQAGPKTVPVSGVVLLDGNPIEGASVTFMSNDGNRVANGITDASGKYTLRTVFGSQLIDGAVPGGHKVGVAKTQSDGAGPPQPKDGETPQEMVNRMAGSPTNTSKVKETFLIPKKFNSPEYSGLTATVSESGANEIELKVTSK